MNPPASPAPVTFALIVKAFAPGWPAVIMGTGAFALATLHFSHQLPMLAGLAWALHWFNLALCVLISIPWLLRWAMAWPAVAATFKHPVAANFYPTYGIALLVLAGELRAFGGHETAALIVWWLGVALLSGLTLAVLISILQGEHVTLDHVTPGIFMYTALLALAFHRFYVHKRLPPMMAPTFWINLAPLGVIVISMLNLVAAAPFAGDKSAYLVTAFLIWGFGAFWLVLATLFTWSVRKIAPLPFSLTWWAFTFPLGAFTLGSQRVSEATGLITPLAFGWLAWVLLAGIWTLTLVKTIAGVASGKLFQPHP